jgi:hypothetical protein
VYKTHIKYSAVAPKESTLLEPPQDAVLVHDLPEWQRHQIGKFLITKGMDFMYLPAELKYSKQRERLLVPSGNGWLGRDLTGASQQKWITYTGLRWLGYPGNGIVVLVEDPFSYFKVKWAMRHDPVDAVCTLGTTAHPALLHQLRFAKTLIMYDGDAAGWAGASRLEHRMRALGWPARDHCAPAGLDPKDMGILDIQNHIALGGRLIGCEDNARVGGSPTL